MCSVKHLLAVLVLTAGCLVAAPTYAANAIQAKELKEFFIAQKRPQDVDRFGELSIQHQQRVLEYASVGKQEQPDERARLKGIVNYMSLLASMEAGQAALTAYTKTGVIKDLPTSYQDSMERALVAFPGASRFIDKAAVLDIEQQSKAVYQDHIRLMEKKIVEAKVTTAEANAKSEQMRKKIAELLMKFQQL